MPIDSRRFNLQIDEFARKVGLSSVTVAKRVGFDLFGRITRKTPVDTGRARGSWTIAVNDANRTVPPAGQADYPIPQVGALALQPGDAIVISNNLPYIVALEQGHSQQAPAGMVAVSIAEIDLAMSQLVRAGLTEAGL